MLLPEPPLDLSPADRELIQGIRQSGSHHKNISYKPRHDKVSGLDGARTDTGERLHTILRRYSEAAIAYAARLLPRYSPHWSVDYASLRPIEEAGRNLSFNKRNDLLHTDAFPTRPTRGGLILRSFWNLHPSRPRVWWTADPIALLAPRFALAAGLNSPSRGRLAKTILRRLGLPITDRSDYDEFMLAFHDYLKNNAEFQSHGPKYRMEFPPGAAWMAFTDVVPHAVESGQFAMEQTLIVPRNALAAPDRAPISILEGLAVPPAGLKWAGSWPVAAAC